MPATLEIATKQGSSRYLTLAAMSLGYGVVRLDVTIVNVAIDSIGHSFGGGVPALQWVVTAYTTAFAALILTAGALETGAVRQSSPRRAPSSNQGGRYEREHKVGFVDFADFRSGSIAFVAFRRGLFWCETGAVRARSFVRSTPLVLEPQQVILVGDSDLHLRATLRLYSCNDETLAAMLSASAFTNGT